MARPRFRRPPPADPYAVEEIVVRRRDPRWIFLWLLAIGVFAALLIFIFVATRDDEDPAPARLVAVPRVLGADHVPAGATVEAAGLFADTFPVENNRPLGQVVAQAPPPGERIRAGTPVRLEVSRGPAASRVTFGTSRAMPGGPDRSHDLPRDTLRRCQRTGARAATGRGRLRRRAGSGHALRRPVESGSHGELPKSG